jgi:glycosyltransferase involved in cell wall biosynthesis
MIKGKVSVLIPSRNEPHLQKTINDLLKKASGDVEIIVHLDEIWPDPPLDDHPKVSIIYHNESVGMRAGINACFAISSGEYILKSDAHCMFGEGWDEILKNDCDDDWVVVPRRLSLDAENWGILQNGKRPVDAHFLSYPFAKPEEIGMHGTVWIDRAKALIEEPISDEMSSQGSCYFMKRQYYKKLGLLNEEGYGRFVQEFQEVGNSCWLTGGRVIVNKNTWYAHWHKGKANGRGYFIDKRSMVRGAHYSADHWLHNRHAGLVRDFSWLISHFSPPGWPENWQEEIMSYKLWPDGFIRKIGE